MQVHARVVDVSILTMPRDIGLGQRFTPELARTSVKSICMIWQKITIFLF